MHDAAHPGGLASRRHALGQLHVHTFKLGLTAVQDGHQMHHRLTAGQHACEVPVVVHVGLHQLHRRQRLQRQAMAKTARGHHDASTGAAAALHQVLAHGMADKARAAQDGDLTLHDATLRAANL